MFRIFFIIFFLSIVTQNLKAQLVSGALGKKDLQYDILSATSLFDSLVLFDNSSFWSGDLTIKGFGYKKTKCYKVTLFFRKKDEFVLDLRRVEKDNDPVFEVLKTYLDSKFSALKNLNNDSLNLKSRTGTYEGMSDQSELTILVVFPKQQICLYKNSYFPEGYQKQAWTADRQVLMDVFKRLAIHIK